MKRLFWAGMGMLALSVGGREARAEPIFENIPVITAPGHQGGAAIWGNYIVWKGAVNEAYNIEQRKRVEMPGLNIDGDPAIWDNKVVWSGANGYYDINLQQMIYAEGLSVGDEPAIHDYKIVWGSSTGYYDLSLEQMIYPASLSIDNEPDIFGDKIVWDQSKGYYDIGSEQMVYPEGLSVGLGPAIYDNKIAWFYLVARTGYYDIDLQQYVSLEEATGVFCSPDIFEDRIVWNTYDVVPPRTIDIFIWDPIFKQVQVTESGCAHGAKIYDNIIVWVDTRSGDADIYMAIIPEPGTVLLLGLGVFILRRRK